MRLGEVPLTIIAGIVAVIYMMGGNVEIIALYCGGAMIVAGLMALIIIILIKVRSLRNG